MKKILVVSNLYSPYIIGGAEIICQKISEALSVSGYDVTVLTTGKSNITTSDTVNNITVIRLKKTNLYFIKQQSRPNRLKRLLWHVIDVYNFGVKKELDQIILELKPDVALCHNISGFSVSIWDCLQKNGVPIIQVLHDQYFCCPNSNSFKKGSTCEKQCLSCQIMRLPHKWMSNKVDVVIGVSEYVLKRITRFGYFKFSQKHVIYNAQNIEDKIKKTFWNGQPSFKIGYIGNLSEVKGVRILIEAFKCLSIDAELMIAGNGSSDYVDYLKKFAADDRRIRFLGYMNSSDFFESIDLCVLPSVWADTFPGVAYESCAHHVPVIASDIGGIPEIIHTDKNGILVKAGSVDDLKNAIMYMYDHPEKLEMYSRQARAEVAKMLDTKNWILAYKSIIDNILCVKP